MPFTTSRNNNEIVIICCRGNGAMLSCQNVCQCEYPNSETLKTSLTILIFPIQTEVNLARLNSSCVRAALLSFSVLRAYQQLQRVAAGIRVVRVFLGKPCRPARAAPRRGSGELAGVAARPPQGRVTAASPAGNGRLVSGQRPRGGPQCARAAGRGHQTPSGARRAGCRRALRRAAAKGKAREAGGGWRARGFAQAFEHRGFWLLPGVSPWLSNIPDPQPQALAPCVCRGANPAARSPAPGVSPTLRARPAAAAALLPLRKNKSVAVLSARPLFGKGSALRLCGPGRRGAEAVGWGRWQEGWVRTAAPPFRGAKPGRGGVGVSLHRSDPTTPHP